MFKKIRQSPKISKKIVISCLFFIVAAVFLCSSIVLAQGPDLGVNYARNLDLPDTDPRLAIVKLVRLALTFVGIIAIIIIMYAGYLWTVSGGSPEKVARAKKTLVNAVIGLIIIMASFAIVSFVINKWGDLPGLEPGPGPQVPGPGIGIIGNCAIESVYPEPYQRDVPRNTGIIVTFMEEVDPDSIIDSANAPYIFDDGRIRIYTSGNYDNPSAWVTDVQVSTNDNRTFIFQPDNFLGSPSEHIWYYVYLSNDIMKLDGSEGIFEDCGIDKDFGWQFEVSNLVDLTPPQVASVFPPLDNAQDTSNTTPAMQATGSITVNNQPQTYFASSFGAINSIGGSPLASVVMDSHNQESGTLTVTIQSDGITASLSNSAILLGSAATANGSVTFNGFLTLALTNYPADNFVAGNSWDITGVTAEIQADNLTAGGIVYIFVSGAPSGNEIQVNGINGTASNITGALNTHPDVSGLAAGAAIAVTARVAGTAGNNILLATNNIAILTIIPMSGGENGQTTVTVNGQPDKARNAVIQVNFNEAVNPLTLSGDAVDVANYIRVVDISSGSNLSGKFVMSNQYRTVEFISDNLCGVNGCGEQVYCLPPDSNLRVELMAANLAICPVPINCAVRTPYNICAANNHCQNAAGENYPLSVFPLDGIADMALNSLDGNRDDDADGPITFYNENNPNPANGDNFQWSFWISDIIDLTPPEITSTVPGHTDPGVSLSDPILVNFDKLMMSSSLKTGQTRIFNGQDYFMHKLINLWGHGNQSVGYWITKNDVDTSVPLDGFGDYTRAEIRHSIFADLTSYRTQVGSGVKDIYQNCYKPSVGPADNVGGTCAAGAVNPSCCPVGAVIGPTTVPSGQSCP